MSVLMRLFDVLKLIRARIFKQFALHFLFHISRKYEKKNPIECQLYIYIHVKKPECLLTPRERRKMRFWHGETSIQRAGTEVFCVDPGTKMFLLQSFES